jgi:hypothetical protein
MLQEQQKTVLMRSNIRKLTYVLLLNTPYSRLYTFCATGVISALSVSVTFTLVDGETGGVCYTGKDFLLILFFLS